MQTEWTHLTLLTLSVDYSRMVCQSFYEPHFLALEAEFNATFLDILDFSPYSIVLNLNFSLAFSQICVAFTCGKVLIKEVEFTIKCSYK